LKAILMNVVSILASYGVLVLVFQHGFGEKLLNFEHLGRLSMFAPVILFSILFGLSTDYEVFLLSRVKELFSHHRDNERSVMMVPASMKLMGAANWWMPKFLDWIPTIKEAPEEPVPVYEHEAVDSLPPGYRPCQVCGTTLRASARFCGRCGARMNGEAGRGA